MPSSSSLSTDFTLTITESYDSKDDEEDSPSTSSASQNNENELEGEREVKIEVTAPPQIITTSMTLEIKPTQTFATSMSSQTAFSTTNSKLDLESTQNNVDSDNEVNEKSNFEADIKDSAKEACEENVIEQELQDSSSNSPEASSKSVLQSSISTYENIKVTPTTQSVGPSSLLQYEKKKDDTPSRSDANTISTDKKKKKKQPRATVLSSETSERSRLRGRKTRAKKKQKTSSYSIDLTKPAHQVRISPTPAVVPSTSKADHFLGLEAPELVGPALQDEPRYIKDSHLEIGTDFGIDLPDFSIDIPEGSSLGKMYRAANPSPDMNDILSGLLNVVGEGLSLATNYVKDESSKKKHELTKKKIVPLRTRINNRGPPRYTEIPFEAIPLEVLTSPRPGENPAIQIPQRPFQTRIKVTKTRRKPPYATGIPLPELLVPPFKGFNADKNLVVEKPIAFPSSGQDSVFELYNTGDGENDKVTEKVKDLTTLANKLEHTYYPDNDDITITTEFLLDKDSTTDKEKFEAQLTTSRPRLPPTRFPPKRRPRPPKTPQTTTKRTTTTSTTTTSTTTTTTTTTTKSTTTTSESTTERKNEDSVRLTTSTTTTTPTTTSTTTRRTTGTTVSSARPTPPLTTKESMRPGLVLDPLPDLITRRPSLRPGRPSRPEIFDVTVSALQNYGGKKYQRPKPGKFLS